MKGNQSKYYNDALTGFYQSKGVACTRQDGAMAPQRTNII